jgi:aldehyde:ferredoxin oxidoreductase
MPQFNAGVVMFGYAGKLLYADLTRGSLEERRTPTALARAFLGGRGLGAALLYQELKPRADPLGPENVLILMTAPPVGTPIPCCHRWEAVTKSPLTGFYLCSSVGGHWGPELKFAGFDGIVIKGKASEPVYISIKDGKAELRDASKLWGKLTDETELAIRRELKDPRVQVACIGPAGENLVRIANIQAGRRSIGRGGAGAVMGSKNLKAIAIRGHGKFEVADEEEVTTLVRELREQIKRSPQTAVDFPTWGTVQFVDPINEAGMWPTRNFQEGVFELAHQINARAMRKQLVKRDTACFGCPVACGKLSIVAEGPYANTVVEGPEYETMWAFGAQCGIGRLDAIAAANAWCDKYGLDTISAGNVIGFAMECYERGLLTQKDTDGLDLKFGNHRALVKLLRKMAYRGGFGKVLCDGVRCAAAHIQQGSEEFAIHVKGLELPAYDPRGAWGMALAYATACRGGCHLKAWTLAAEVFEAKYDRFSTKGKAKLIVELQNTRAAADSMGVCIIAGRAIGEEERARIMTALTGWSFNAKKLAEAGERIYNLERLLAVRDGITRKDDVLPPRLLTQALPSGPCKGIQLRKVNLDQMLDDYYELRGWDRGGKPTKAKLKELGITKLLK